MSWADRRLFARSKDLDRSHLDLRNKEEKAADVEVTKRVPKDKPRLALYDQMLATTFNYHVRSLGYEWYSMPETILVESHCFTSLEDHLCARIEGLTPDAEEVLDRAPAAAGNPDDNNEGEAMTFKQAYFRIVNWNPSKLKVLRQRGGARRIERRLSASAVAISVHGSGVDRDGNVLVTTDAEKIQLDSVSPIMFVDKLAENIGNDLFREHFLGWTDWTAKQDEPHDKSDISFHIRGYIADRLHGEAVTALVCAGAWQASHAARPPTPVMQDELQALVRKGFVAEVGDASCPKYHFTPMGVRSLGSAKCLKDPVKVATPRPDLPLGDLSTYELIRALESRGFAWKPMPRKNRDELVFDLHMPPGVHSTQVLHVGHVGARYCHRAGRHRPRAASHERQVLQRAV